MCVLPLNLSFVSEGYSVNSSLAVGYHQTDHSMVNVIFDLAFQ